MFLPEVFLDSVLPYYVGWRMRFFKLESLAEYLRSAWTSIVLHGEHFALFFFKRDDYHVRRRELVIVLRYLEHRVDLRLDLVHLFEVLLGDGLATLLQLADQRAIVTTEGHVRDLDLFQAVGYDAVLEEI